MTGELDSRLLRLKAELEDHARIARYLGLDFERPIRSLGDGYPENAIAWVGKITERLLKRLWRHHNAPGSPAGKTLKDLIAGCRPYIRSHNVIEALRDIQRLRNRSTHDGYVVADEDALTAVRRLLDVLAWYTSTGSDALGGNAPRLAPAVAAKAEFLAGLYVTLDFKPASRFELSRHTLYQLLVRERGLRTEYVELLLSKDAGEIAEVFQATGGELLQTSLPKLTRFLILEQDGGPLPEQLREDCRVVTYDHFMDTLVDLDRHVADVAGQYPRLDAAGQPVLGDLLTADERSGDMQISEVGAASELLEKVAASGGNLLIVGRPGSGKTTLLKQLVAAAPRAGARRYRFFLDLSDHPLITYEAWREELDRGRLKDALPCPVDAHPGNVSPFGVREMAGNVWEFTGTVLEDLNEAVICGGSFDNLYRAVQASSKETYRRRGASNAVGFRCAEDLP